MSAVIDFPVKPEARPYLDAFTESASEPQWLRNARRASLNRFAEVGFPSRRNESWRYFDLQPLQRLPLLPSVTRANPPVPPEVGYDLAWVQINLFDGVCSSIVRRSPMPEGIWIAGAPRAIEQRPELVRAPFSEASGAEEPFAFANGALFTDGFAVDLAPGSALDAAIGVIHYATAAGSLHTRSIVNLGEGSRATIVETFTGEGVRYWRNDVVAVRLADGAHLTRIVLVEEGADAIHTALTDVRVGAGARFEEFVLLLGGSRVRHEANICLAGDGASCDINGAYIVAGDDEANIVTAIDHAAPGGRTSELIKGVAAGRGHGAFQGRIVVRPHAQKTDARQMSRNLLLGRRAVIDTKPELQIDADDVKCAHGASVGDLDEAALFYLRARGIPAEEARRMLIEGFLREPVEAIANAAVREHLLRRLGARLAVLEG